MFQLLSPAGLWALAALALPLAIHLWRPPPKTVRLGSLRFLENFPHRRLRHLRWRERALLAVRLALLAALALLVAGLRWQEKPPAGPQRWVLLDPTAAISGSSADRLRQLRADGYTLHQLAPGLPSVDSLLPASPAAGPMPPPDLWSLLREADAALPAGSRLAVFTPGRNAALRGARPALRHAHVDWIGTPDATATTARSWIESLRSDASPGSAGNARALVGNSDAGSTSFVHVLWPPARGMPAGSPMEFSPDGSSARLTLPTPGPWVAGNKIRSPLRLAILHDPDRAGDARSVAAAVQAVAAVTGQPLTVTTRPLDGSPGSIQPPAADWVFWLSARPVPAAVAAGVANLVRDAGTGPRDVFALTEGWIVAPPGSPGAAALAEASVRLWCRVPAALPSAGNAATIWTDGHGEPLLTLERVASGRRWQFYSRFDPDWTDLPRTAALPAALGGLLFPPPPALPADAAHDLRLADPAQYSLSLLPALASAPMAAAPTHPAAADLHWPLWLLAAALFAVERFLSRHSPPRPVPALATPATALAR